MTSFEGVIPNPAPFSRVRDLARTLPACVAVLPRDPFDFAHGRLFTPLKSGLVQDDTAESDPCELKLRPREEPMYLPVFRRWHRMSVRGKPLMGNPETWKKWEGRADGKFPLRQWLGGSDHSAVFLTERPGQMNQKFAIKLISADVLADQQLSQWRAAAQLSHPHLMRIYDAGRCRLDGTPLLYLVMEYAEENLAQILPHRPLAAAEVTDMLPPLLDALSYLHNKGFVHGRIKPSNVHATDDQVKLSADQIVPFSELNPARRRHDV